jgi:hypothetical protein
VTCDSALASGTIEFKKIARLATRVAAISAMAVMAVTDLTIVNPR